jgi:uncharacterized delta-60 repeat protein
MSHSKANLGQQGFDPDFANLGMFYEFAEGSSPMEIVGRTPDGKNLLAGSAVLTVEGKPFHKIQVVQLLEDGTPDPDFGTNGFVVRSFKDNHHAQTDAAHLLKDGKILLIGRHGEALTQLAFARFLENGSPDLAFGEDGVYIPPITSTPNLSPTTERKSRNALPAPTAIGPRGEIFIANVNTITKYTSDGLKDDNFTASPVKIKAMRVSASGKITVAGISLGSNQGIIGRLKPDGSEDEDYGDDGYVFFEALPGNRNMTEITCMVLREDDSVFVAGSADSNVSTPERATVRGMLAAFNNNGKPNLVFNGGKPIITELPSGQSCRWKDIAHFAPDKLVVVGSTGKRNIESSLIARYETSGVIDSSFGDNGHRVTDIGIGREEWLSVLVQPDEKILVSGDNTIEKVPATLVRYQKT